MVGRGPPSERSVADLRSFGVVNLDKPPGPSSHEVSAWIRDLVGVDRAAHAGTLDPKVTGCLPVLLGDATRLAQAFLQGHKEYIAVLELHDHPPADLAAVVQEFEAPLYQKPPRKSAVRRQLRVREIYDLDVLDVDGRQVLLFVRCESGTYVRKLCHDLGLALGTGGHMVDLRRAGTTPFTDASLVTMEELTDALVWHDAGHDDPPISVEDVILPAEHALSHLPAVTIAPSAAESVANGAPVYAPGVIDIEEAAFDSKTTGAGADSATDRPPLVACYTPDGAVVCLGRVTGDPDAQQGVTVSLERVLL